MRKNDRTRIKDSSSKKSDSNVWGASTIVLTIGHVAISQIAPTFRLSVGLGWDGLGMSQFPSYHWQFDSNLQVGPFTDAAVQDKPLRRKRHGSLQLGYHHHARRSFGLLFATFFFAFEQNPYAQTMKKISFLSWQNCHEEVSGMWGAQCPTPNAGDLRPLMQNLQRLECTAYKWSLLF
jgi:hypothetical protein